MAVATDIEALVVDDEEVMRNVLTKVLRDMGFAEVASASDGRMALEMLRGGNFGLVLSDWRMEPMMGIDLLRAVRADDKLAGMPFILVTAESAVQNRDEAAGAGVSAYILKPFDAETLEREVTNVLAVA